MTPDQLAHLRICADGLIKELESRKPTIKASSFESVALEAMRKQGFEDALRFITTIAHSEIDKDDHPEFTDVTDTTFKETSQ